MRVYFTPPDCFLQSPHQLRCSRVDFAMSKTSVIEMGVRDERWQDQASSDLCQSFDGWADDSESTPRASTCGRTERLADRPGVCGPGGQWSQRARRAPRL